MKSTPRTWLFVLLAVVLSGIIAWFETRDRDPRAPEPATEADHGGDYTVDVELVPADGDGE